MLERNELHVQVGGEGDDQEGGEGDDQEGGEGE